MSGSRTGHTRDVLLAIYVAVCIAALVWPGYDWFGNRIEPFVLGVPFSLAWVAGWVLLTFVVLSAYHLSAPRERGRDGS